MECPQFALSSLGNRRRCLLRMRSKERKGSHELLSVRPLLPWKQEALFVEYVK